MSPAAPVAGPYDAVIVGGGIAGLACGVALAESKARVAVIEAGDILGGRARSWTDPATGDVVDIGPHILLSEYRNMLHLLRVLGSEGSITWESSKFLTLVDDAGPATIRMSRLPPPLHFVPSLLAVPQVTWRELATNRRLMWQVMRMSDASLHRMDGVTARDMLAGFGVSPHFIDWFWRTAAMTTMNVPLEQCSAQSLLQFFRFMIGRNGYQVGFAASGLGELFVPRAVRLIERAGGAILHEQRAASLVIEQQRIAGVRLADGTLVTGSACVLAIPPQELRQILPEQCLRQGPLSRLADWTPSPYISSYLWFDRKLTKERFWCRVWRRDNVNYDSYDLSNIRTGWADRDSVIASNIIYSSRVGAMTDSEVIRRTLDELRQFLPEINDAQLLHSRVHRVPMAIPAPLPGSESLRPATATDIEGLYLAGDWIQTGLPSCMESAVRAGFLAAENILARLGRPQPWAFAPPPVTTWRWPTSTGAP